MAGKLSLLTIGTNFVLSILSFRIYWVNLSERQFKYVELKFLTKFCVLIKEGLVKNAYLKA